MRTKILLILLICISCVINAQTVTPPKTLIFDDNVVSKIDIYLPADSLAFLLDEDNLFSEITVNADFKFTNGSIEENVSNVGFRPRGNSGITAEKKSFKVSFNEYDGNKKFHGLEKLNLISTHNDPTMSRPKICFDILEQMQLPGSRANHVRLYINDNYFGLYNNVEHIDEEFVNVRFGNKDGNLYKCLYPASLEYLGENPELFRYEIYGRRPYELKTNTDEDDYSDLAEFINILNNTNTSDLPCALEKVFNVDPFLKNMAYDILIGHWDGPLFNQNNFYLYHNTATDLFEFIPYDLDNTIGNNFIQMNWANRNIYNWTSSSMPMPIYSKIMAVEAYRDRFSFYMQEILQEVYNTEKLFPYLDDLLTSIAYSASFDDYFPLDYGFTISDFYDNFEQGLFDYLFLPHGLKTFINLRSSSASGQLEIEDIHPIIHLDQDQNLIVDQSINCTIIEDNSIMSAKVCYALNNNDFSCVDLSNDGQHFDGEAGDAEWGWTLDELEGAGVVQYYFEVIDDADQATRSPNCEGTFERYFNSTYTGLVINELMAKNYGNFQNDNQEFEDWIELYNNGPNAINLNGLFLSDNADLPNQWPLPNVEISPGEYIIFFADNDEGSFHCNFKLSSHGEFLGLYGAEDQAFPLLDGIQFPALDDDQAWGRFPNGRGNFQELIPTAGFSNEPIPTNISEAINENLSSKNKLKIYPNPWEKALTISFANVSREPVTIHLANSLGQIVDSKKRSREQFVRFSSTGLNGGIYFIIVQHKNGQQEIYKSVLFD